MRTLLLVLVLGFLRPAWAGPKAAGYGPLASGNRCLEVSGAKLFSKACDGSPNQQWKLTATTGGYYQITSQPNGDGKCLDIVNDGRSNNRLTLAACSNVSGQHWKMTPVGGRVVLTTEWRGDGKCLDIVDSTANIQPILSDCAKSATQGWKVGATEPAAGSAKVKDRAAPLDGVFEPTFVLIFKECAFAMPGLSNGELFTMFACMRPTKQRAVCRVSYGHLDDAFQPSRSVFEATVTTDTADTLTFVTADDDIKVRVDRKKNEGTVTQRDTKASCTKGLHGTAAAMRQAIKEIQKQARAEAQQNARDDAPAESAPAPSRSRPEPKAKPKGLAHGRMCGRDSECESGTCKMENRTRGRCS